MMEYLRGTDTYKKSRCLEQVFGVFGAHLKEGNSLRGNEKAMTETMSHTP